MGLWAGAVDLVYQQHVCEDRPWLELERRALGVVYVNARYVGGHEIRRALHTPVVAAERLREGFAEQRLADTGRAFEQYVAAAKQRNACLVDDVSNAEQHLAQLALQMGFQQLRLVCHGAPTLPCVSRRMRLCSFRN